MNELKELIESLTEDAWRLMVLERDITNPYTSESERQELLKEYREKSMRVFGELRRDRQTG